MTETEGRRPTRSAARAPLTAAAKRAMISAGHMDAETGATRNAKRTRCPVCALPIWRGFSADRGYQTVEADPQPLAPLGEALARFGGWRTFTLRFLLVRYVLDIRDQFIISGEPAGTMANCDVLTEHNCGADTNPLPKRESRIIQPRPAAISTENAPF